MIFCIRKKDWGKIAKINSVTYSALKSRHRGVLYNDYIEKIKRDQSYMTSVIFSEEENEFLFPHIL